MEPIHIIGAGLAGCEAAFQAAEAGARVVLYEMRPQKAHARRIKTDAFGELVCSNSLKSEQVHSAPWLLKQEMRQLGSLLMRAAEVGARSGRTCADGGSRSVFARDYGGDRSASAHRDPARRDHADSGDGIVIIASGPLTSEPLAEEISRITGSDRLYFYDSISPIVAADSIDMSVAFRASRYGKSLDGTDDYINCPFNKEQYEAFVEARARRRSSTSRILQKTRRRFLRPACRLKRSRGAGARRCASDR